MQDGDTAREAGNKALYGLGGERYFRHQHNAPPAQLYNFRQRLQVYLGLAAAGNAVEQGNLGVYPFIMHCFPDAREGNLLSPG